MSEVTNELKTYALLKHTEPSVPVYRRVNKDQRIRIDKRAIDHAYMRVTYYDSGLKKNRTIRLKLNSNKIDQAEQIKDELILANEPFTDAERRAVEFREGILMTRIPIVQEFLEASPQFEGFKGESRGPDIKEPLYRLLDRKGDVKSSNKMFVKRVAAAKKVADLYEDGDLAAGQDLMIRVNGTFYTPPTDLDNVIDELTKFIDDADEPMLDKLLQEEDNIDEKMTILISRAVMEKIISFDQVPGQIVKITNPDKPVTLREIPATYSEEERIRYFSAFLSSSEGKLLKEDLQAEVDKKVGRKGGAKKGKQKEQEE